MLLEFHRCQIIVCIYEDVLFMSEAKTDAGVCLTTTLPTLTKKNAHLLAEGLRRSLFNKRIRQQSNCFLYPHTDKG